MTCKIDPAWKRRLQKANKEYPELQPLRKKLLKIGGAEIVSRFEEDLDKILKRGKLIQAPVKMKLMTSSQCHKNVARLYDDKKVDTIITGWALSNDCAWRQHTWGIKQGKIIETTEKRKKYFGFILNKEEADTFSWENE